MCFSASFWNERYLQEKTGWDLKAPSTPLKEYIDQLEDKNLRILIPGCGNAYEAEYLIEKGFTNITLIDISDVLIQSLQEKFKDYSSIQLVNQDFFEFTGEFDLIIEQTFFCAIDPSLRGAYAQKMNELLAPNGKLVGVLFNHDFGNPFPPFGGSLTEYHRLFTPIFNVIKLEECYNSIKPRMGTEVFIHFQKKAK